MGIGFPDHGAALIDVTPAAGDFFDILGLVFKFRVDGDRDPIDGGLSFSAEVNEFAFTKSDPQHQGKSHAGNDCGHGGPERRSTADVRRLSPGDHEQGEASQ